MLGVCAHDPATAPARHWLRLLRRCAAGPVGFGLTLSLDHVTT